MTTILDFEQYTVGLSEGPRNQNMDPEMDDIFGRWQSQFCALSEIEISDHSIDSMLDELPELGDDIAVVPLAVHSLPMSSLAGTFSTPPTVTIAAPSPFLKTATLTSVTADIGPQAVQVPASMLRDASAVTPRPATAIPSCDPISPQLSTPLKMNNPLNFEDKSQGEPSITIAPTGAVKPKKSRVAKASAKKAKVKDSAVPKEIRITSPADHIIRERQRRDDMATKYSILESLLPTAAKRERAVIVDDAMQFVKNLQHRKKELLKRRDQLKLEEQPQTGVSLKPPSRPRNAAVHDESGSLISASSMDLRQPVATSPGLIAAAPALQNMSAGRGSKSCVKTLQIHAHFSEEILIEMVCSRPRPNFQSHLIQIVESLSLDVSRCSLHRLPHGFMQCMISAKRQVPHMNPEMQSIPSTVAALRAAFEHI